MLTGMALAITPFAYADTYSPADDIVLPKPVTTLPTFNGIGLRPDRRLVSSVPGEVRTTEDVTVAVAGDGQPVTVMLDERLRLSGTGNYLIYERGPAREARPLGDSIPPVLKLGTVIWQGFSPGSRDLAARLRLDPTLEAERLPLRVSLSFQPTGGGKAQPLRPGGETPGAGTVVLHLENTTGQPQNLATGLATTDDIVGPLDTLLTTARRALAQPAQALVLPVAGRGLPTRIPAAGVTQTLGFVIAPLRVSGTITAPGTTASLNGPTTTLIDGGGRVQGVLSSTVDFRLDVPAAARVAVDLTVTPTLDERTLRPPSGSNWVAWAQTNPTEEHRRAATSQLVNAAASAARAASISPYVGADTPGAATTTFHYRLADAAEVATAPRKLEPKPFALALVGVVALALVGGGSALWRRL
ncbi:MAG: hypothetical protein QOG53_2070 [Frankiales bacterium]|nr:hypothetical protein [Frankiales bacterium]